MTTLTLAGATLFHGERGYPIDKALFARIDPFAPDACERVAQALYRANQCLAPSTYLARMKRAEHLPQVMGDDQARFQMPHVVTFHGNGFVVSWTSGKPVRLPMP